MRLWVRCTAVAICGLVLAGARPTCSAQEEGAENHRKIVSKVAPNFPPLAHDMHIAGAVKIEAVVAPNGTVRSTAILGGHPVLAQSAVDAVRRCKWETGPHETKEIVILNFHPE
jgi:outer membrane biosynthesis protein TonB